MVGLESWATSDLMDMPTQVKPNIRATLTCVSPLDDRWATNVLSCSSYVAVL
jgi:hypothetical protein